MLLNQILSYVEQRDMDKLKTLLASAEEIEILDAFYDLSNDDQVIVFRLLAKDHALRIFEELDTDMQQNLLRSFADEKRVIEFVDGMAPDDRVRLLDELPALVAKKLIDSLSPEERAVTGVLMGYEPETAGRIMTTEYISLRREMTAEEALEKVRRQAKDKETIYTLYITDNSKKLEGVISLKELLMADSGAVLEDIMSKKTIKVFTGDDQEEVAKALQELDLLAIPVVDSEERLVGIVTIDDAVDILEDEATEDILDHAGFVSVKGKENDRSETLVKGSMWKIWRVRMPFLLITLIAGFLAASIIAGFEEALESIAVVAFFIPLIMDMGGNVGTQSSTVFARGVVLGHIDTKRMLRHLAKETAIGLSMGALVGGLAGITIFALAYFWPTMPAMLGLAVGISVAFTMTLAALLGFLVPYLLMKLKMDQAAGSAPIITSIKDILGLLIYFVSVTAFLGNML